MYRLALACVLSVAFALATPLITPLRAQTIETPASHAVLMDYDTGLILFEKNADALMPPASMSKLMTVEMVFQRLKDGRLTRDSMFHVSEKAWRKGGSKMWVEVDTDIRVEDLLRGIIVQSGNDACIVVAEGISGSEETFARDMTERAREIGLEKSTFANSTGWPDPNQRMTARELALLARHLIRDYPEYYPYFAETEFEWSDISQPNRNPLLYLGIGADGLKTGHTEESGYGLVASAVRGGQRLVLVVNGLNSEAQRKNESRRLIDLGFREFQSYALLNAGDVVDEAPVWKGNYDRVPLVVADDVSVILRRDARKDMKVTVHYTGPLQAPIAAGQEVGFLRVSAPGAPTREVKVLSGANVEPLGLMGQAAFGLRYLLFGG